MAAAMTQAAEHDDSRAARMHVPVLVAEVCGMAAASAPREIVDATVGTAGHAGALLRATGARLLGLDRDAGALAVAAERLAEFSARVTLRQANFANLAVVMAEVGFQSAGAILADLGMSSFALEDPARGFSFRLDGPLDMRMDRDAPLRAYDILNEESEEEIARVIYQYGEERASRRIARGIVAARRRRPLTTTAELRAIVERALGAHRRAGAHPATRTFQALRIAVNQEMESLAALLADGPNLLASGGRMMVIAYHSLEDRAVKERFRELVRGGEFIAVTRKAIKPSAAEVAENPRARSARLRCIERSA